MVQWGAMRGPYIEKDFKEDKNKGLKGATTGWGESETSELVRRGIGFLRRRNNSMQELDV